MEIKLGNKEVRIKFLGMRVVKTVIAVYVCFLIDFLRDGMPFYSAIAAILCMQKDYDAGFKAGKNRMVGTFIGGIYGFLTTVLINSLNITPFNSVHYLILSLFLIPIIYTNVLMKSSSSAYISCVVFLSITISHSTDAPLMFAINRVIDTLIGIVVSLAINKLMPHKEEAEISEQK